MEEGDGGSGQKPALPAVLKELGKHAIARMEKRPATPEIEVGREEGGWTFQSPYRAEDLEEWEALLFEPFATRSLAAFHVFTTQLSELSPSVWKGDEKGWMPNDYDLRAAIQIVRSVKPRNEAEACLAAQMVAVHRMQMKLSAQALGQSRPEPKTCAIAGKLARTYAMQLETVAKLKGKGARQRITVRKYSQHEHKHVHLHQGGSENGNQPHGPRETTQPAVVAAGKPPRCQALPGADAPRNSLPEPRDQGKKAMPTARRRSRIRRAERH